MPEGSAPSASSPSRTERRFSARWEELAASKASPLIEQVLKKEKNPGKSGILWWKLLHGPFSSCSCCPREFAGRGLQKATFKIYLHHISLFHVRLSLPNGLNFCFPERS